MVGESTSSAIFPIGKGEMKDLTCVATGNPPPAITMKKGSSALAPEVSTNGNKVKAVFKYSANKSADAGVVKCIANNSVGEVSHDITIRVLGMFIILCSLSPLQRCFELPCQFYRNRDVEVSRYTEM